MARFPGAWETAGARLVAALQTGRAEAVSRMVGEAAAEAALWVERLRRSGGNPKVAEAARPHLARARMLRLAVERTALAAASGQHGGRVRFGLWSGALVQRLLFARGLERKPASLRAFRLLWPLVAQKRILMPLVQPHGIYCFYSRELVRALAALIGDRPCLEIAAGDGTLARFLRGAGVAVTATDDQSWSHAVTYPAEVVRLDARAALKQHRPKAVLCSWPPPGNAFERHVFRQPAVELYVVVGSRHRFAAGDFEAYEAQREFAFERDDALSSLVLPPELDPAVYVFRRLRRDEE